MQIYRPSFYRTQGKANRVRRILVYSFSLHSNLKCLLRRLCDQTQSSVMVFVRSVKGRIRRVLRSMLEFYRVVHGEPAKAQSQCRSKPFSCKSDAYEVSDTQSGNNRVLHKHKKTLDCFPFTVSDCVNNDKAGRVQRT